MTRILEKQLKPIRLLSNQIEYKYTNRKRLNYTRGRLHPPQNINERVFNSNRGNNGELNGVAYSSN